MEPQTVSKPKRPGVVTAILLMLGLALLGIVLGCLGVYAWPAGLFNRWRNLPEFPARVGQIAGATVETVDVASADGQLFRFDLRAKENGWQAVDSPLSETDAGCEPFAAKAPRFAQGEQRKVACQNYADAGTTTIFVLLSSGRIAYWTRFDSAYGTLAALIFVPLGGSLLGALLGLIIFLNLRRRRA